MFLIWFSCFVKGQALVSGVPVCEGRLCQIVFFHRRLHSTFDRISPGWRSLCLVISMFVDFFLIMCRFWKSVFLIMFFFQRIIFSVFLNLCNFKIKFYTMASDFTIFASNWLLSMPWMPNFNFQVDISEVADDKSSSPFVSGKILSQKGLVTFSRTN